MPASVTRRQSRGLSVVLAAMTQLARRWVSGATAGERSIREQELQIFEREALGEFFLAEDVQGEGALLLLQRADLFLDAVFDQQAVGDDLVDLADPMCPVNGLVLHGRIPPGIEE